MKKDENAYVAVVESIRLMALNIYFDEIQALETHA